MRPSLWAALFGSLQELANPAYWYQADPANASAIEIAAEFDAAASLAALTGCGMIGDIRWIAREVASHELVCDGSVFNRVDHPLLYDAIDSFYVLDADSALVPNLIGSFARGATSPGGEGGADTVTLSVTEMPSHQHLYSDAGLPDVPVLGPGEVPVNALSGASLTTATGGGGAHENRPPYHNLIPVIIAGYPTAG